MKRIFTGIMVLLLGTSGIHAQSVTGDWKGSLSVQGTGLPLVFHIRSQQDSLYGTMDSPLQGATGIPCSSVTFNGERLDILMDNIGLAFSGTYRQFTHQADGHTGKPDSEKVEGIFSQNGRLLPLVLRKTPPAPNALPVQKDPQPPFHYKITEATFYNGPVALSGTLTMPGNASEKHPVPAVVLVTGSGPQDRDETLMGHKPFWMIADYLSNHGYAVLRYDDRGVGKSKGTFSGSTTDTFAADAYAGVKYLKTVPGIGKTGIMGHSEGGLIAPMVAAEHPEKVGFIVLLAGPGLRGDSLLLLQQKVILAKSGISVELLQKNYHENKKVFDLVHTIADTAVLFPRLKDYIAEAINTAPEYTGLDNAGKQAQIQQQYTAITDPWMLRFIRLDPVPYLKKVQCPVLAVNGTKDVQVPCKENLKAIGDALKAGGNKHYRTMELTGLNHLFQTAETGLPAEYATLQESFSDKALQNIVEWLNKNVQ